MMSLTERCLHVVAQAWACGVDNAQLFPIRAVIGREANWQVGVMALASHWTRFSWRENCLKDVVRLPTKLPHL